MVIERGLPFVGSCGMFLGMENEPAIRILLAEDDLELAEFICEGLRREGYEVDSATDGEVALELAQNNEYALLITDRMMPKLDGIELIDSLRRRNDRRPILILSAKAGVGERVEGLHAGADDYLVKPFAFDELLARIEALLRRTRPEPAPTELQMENLRVDLLQNRVFRGTEELDLQPQEYALLVYLMGHRGRVATRSMIIEQVWHYAVEPPTNVVESRICRLRNKVDRGFSPKLIQTIRGHGYAIRPEK